MNLKQRAMCAPVMILAVCLGDAASAQSAVAPAQEAAYTPLITARQVDPAPGRTRTMETISAASAQRMIDAVVAAAIQRRQALSVAIVDASGSLMAFKRMDGASVGTIEAVLTKTRSALLLETPTRTINASKINSVLGFVSAGFTVLGGAAPIRNGDAVVGAIGVSGAEDDYYYQIGLGAFAE